jgi:hypothetical protein
VSRRLLSGKGFSHGAVAAWTPASLGAALIAWYKADAGVYTDNGTTLATNGQSIQQWNDQSGNGYHLHQTVAGKHPTYKTGILNGLPVVDTDTTVASQGLLTASQPVTLGGTTLSMFAVIKATGNDGNARLIGLVTPGGGDTGADVAMLAMLGTTLVTITGYNAGAKGTGTVSSGTWNQVGTIFDGINDTTYIANTPGTPVAATPTFAASVDIQIMASNGASNGITGQLAECIFTNTALSSPALLNLAGYFTTKWGI